MSSLPSLMPTKPLSLVASANLEGALNLTIQFINKDVEDYQSQDETWGDTTHHQLPPGYRVTLDNPLAVTIQPTLYPPSTPAFTTKYLWFRDKDVDWNNAKGLAQVQVVNINCPSFVYRCHHSFVEVHKIVKAWSALGVAVLVVWDCLLFSHVP